jgi:hypothetical protein
MFTRRRAPLQLPVERHGAPRAITEPARLDLFARFLGDDDIALVPAPFGALVDQLVGQRHHLTGAVHPNSDWLFPGRCAGQPIESEQLAERLNRHGVIRAARVSALDALLTTVPAPVLAKLLDRRPWRVADRSKILGTDWRRYVALRVQS